MTEPSSHLASYMGLEPHLPILIMKEVHGGWLREKINKQCLCMIENPEAVVHLKMNEKLVVDSGKFIFSP